MIPQIQFTDFSFRYLNLQEPSLKNINLEIYPGEKILIIGRSGSGKSTLLQCLNGLIPHSYPGEISGTLKIEEITLPAENIFITSCKVGTILQDQDAQFVGLSVAEDIAFTLENNALPRSVMEEKVSSSLQLVGMEDYANSSPDELSGGQKQHIALAGILASAPQILLFDEPLANLDPASAQDAVCLIRELNNTTGKTVIIAEHRVEECLEAGIDRIIIMENGQICANGTPQEIMADSLLTYHGIRPPLHQYVLHFAGIAKEYTSSATTPDEIQYLDNPAIARLRHWYENQKTVMPDNTPTDKKPILAIKNLSFSYDEKKPVLNNISAEFLPGEIVSILGNNGAGKSTLTYAISGLVHPSTGKIFLDGENIDTWGIKQRGEKIGLIMQNPNLMIIKTTVKDEVATALKAQNIADNIIDQQVANVLKVCGLWGYRNWPISALSYGQKKRVTIASILIQKPRVLILDEPTAGQDLRTYHEFMQFIQKLAQSGIAILIITHDLYLALEYSTRCIVIANSKKIADDSPSEIFNDKEILTKARLRPLSLTALAALINVPAVEFSRRFINSWRDNQ